MSGFRSSAPPAGPPRPYHFPQVTRRTLPNGLRLLITENHNAPIASLRALVKSGSDHDVTDLPGLASFVADLLDEGAGERDAILLSEDIGLLGGALATGSDWDATYVSGDVLSRNLAPMIDIFADVVRRPRFEADSIERARSERLMEILQQRDEAAVIAGKRFSNLLFGTGSYGNSAIGSAESIERISREDVTGFFRRHYLPNNSSIVVSGDVDTNDVLQQLERLFGSWEMGPDMGRPSPSPNVFDSPKIYLIDRPQAVQSEIRIGHAGVPRSCEDYFALSMMNALLGGVFNSRINLNLREVHGYTYGARSTFAFRRQAGPFVVSAPVRNEVTRESVSEVLGELRRIRTGDIEIRELDDVKNYLMGVFPATVQSAGEVAGRLVDMELYELPLNYFDKYRENIGAIDKSEIERVAVKYIDPERTLIVIVGNATQIRDPLKTLGYPIYELDIDGGAIA